MPLGVVKGGVGNVNAMGQDLTGLANLSGLDFGHEIRDGGLAQPHARPVQLWTRRMARASRRDSLPPIVMRTIALALIGICAG